MSNSNQGPLTRKSHGFGLDGFDAHGDGVPWWALTPLYHRENDGASAKVIVSREGGIYQSYRPNE